MPAITSKRPLRLLCYNIKKHFTQECSAVKPKRKAIGVRFSFLFVLVLHFSFWPSTRSLGIAVTTDMCCCCFVSDTSSSTHRRDITYFSSRIWCCSIYLSKTSLCHSKIQKIAYQQLCIGANAGSKSRLCRHTSPTSCVGHGPTMQWTQHRKAAQPTQLAG